MKILDALLLVSGLFFGRVLYGGIKNTFGKKTSIKTNVTTEKAKQLYNSSYGPQQQAVPIPAHKPDFKIPDKISAVEALAIIRDINQRVFRGFFNEKDVLAIISIESSFRPKATRYEAHLPDYSVGLMQLLTSTAKDRGFNGSMQQLMHPSTNILYGMKHLKWSYDYLRQRKSRVTKDEWISSYNMGVGNTLKGRISSNYLKKFKAARGRL